ncbi:MAG: hypothetical protein DWH91_16115 [Planctomycetota bacterium]|nr:MAG: hypothetical protein DWH91_16115 [Planctomycetota bacterium]
MKRVWLTSALLGSLFCSVTGWAIDSVERFGADKPVGGEIKSVSKTEVVVFQKVGNKEEKIPANEVISIEWDGEPAAFGLARGAEAARNYQVALEQLTEAADDAKGGDSKMLADINYYMARASAKMALADPAQAEAAITRLKGWLTANRDNFRFYEGQALLAEVALRSKDYVAADTAYTSLSTAPWADTKMLGQIGQARAALAQNNLAEAQKIFDTVAVIDAKTPLEAARKQQAMLGQASCLQSEKKYPEAIKILEQVIEQADADESRILAEAYVRQGDCLNALGQNPKEAIMAYLHVDVIPSLASEVDLHAESLYQLSKLWGAVGQPGRVAEATAKLEQLYPTSEWAKKLAPGT